MTSTVEAVNRGLRQWAPIIDLLLAHGFDIHARYGNGAKAVIHTAVGSKDFEMARCLVERGADITVVDAGGETTLDVARWIGYATAVRFLGR